MTVMKMNNLREIFVNADRHKAMEDGNHIPVSYNLNKIRHDHKEFEPILKKHMPNHSQLKIVSPKSFTHQFKDQKTLVSVRRLHASNEPVYTVRIKSMHPNKNQMIYQRAMRTRNPTNTLNKMLTECKLCHEQIAG